MILKDLILFKFLKYPFNINIYLNLQPSICQALEKKWWKSNFYNITEVPVQVYHFLRKMAPSKKVKPQKYNLDSIYQ